MLRRRATRAKSAVGECALKSIALVNRFAPADAAGDAPGDAPGDAGAASLAQASTAMAPTAMALARLAALLTARLSAVDLRIVGAGRTYGGGGARNESFWRRATASWRDGAALAATAADCDTVISLTDPPFLGFHLARRLRAESLWVEWTMDLYPEALAAAAGLPPRPARLPGLRRPDLRLCLGPEQAAFLAADGGTPIPQLILPAGGGDPPARPLAPPQGLIHLVYAGNLGRAHWAGALPLLAQACDPARFRLTVAAYGVQASATRHALAAFPHVDWRETPLSEDELNAAHVHVVSLKENWTHVCVPSKAVSALRRGRPILFFGSARSDAWGWAQADGGRDAGLRVDPQTAASALPGVLRRLAAPAQLAALTDQAAKAGLRLRDAEAQAADALAERLTFHTAAPMLQSGETTT